MKVINIKSTANIVQKGEKEVFLQRLATRQRLLLSPLSFNIILEVSTELLFKRMK